MFKPKGRYIGHQPILPVIAITTASTSKMVPTIPVISPVKYAIVIRIASIHLIIRSEFPRFFFNKLKNLDKYS